ncbi:hypothetical protein [Pseudobacteriovorax antillogorgiicola]|uniref:Uncharacterized protein n=1 Tax=Pseudobacteriovorax antillogorgiicola TaxID=1513793 RepID=A0A1Y6C279_9BACT|nr:hypothetical protein [Pseudobacteriovorax antillogorgiicola]TCS50245.1 hypothetical protein EDD56_11363 [Pseudobacteriovorax antillogorgiicola]SMF32861.1 hypothetical protein SAMN06296036_11062 [Pseudobacteriovorax antillogorgiicola]
MKLLPTPILFVLLSYVTACGQAPVQETSFSRPAQQNAEALVAQVTGEFDEDGQLIIPNSLSSSWNGAALLGNSRYQVIAQD